MATKRTLWVCVADLAQRMQIPMGFAMTLTIVWVRLTVVECAMVQVKFMHVVAQTFLKAIVIAMGTR
jgi:hypothetical protein